LNRSLSVCAFSQLTTDVRCIAPHMPHCIYRRFRRANPRFWATGYPEVTTMRPRSPLLGSQKSREFGNIVPGVFTPVLAKHTKSFNLVDTLSVGVDRIQRNFEPMQRHFESWRETQIADAQAKLIFYSGLLRQARRSKELGARSPPLVLRAAVSGVYAEDDVGACRTRSPALSRGLIWLPSSMRRQDWVSSWRLRSSRPFSDEWRYRPDRRPFTTPFARQAFRADVGFGDSLISHKPVCTSASG
jgi:hypothetical protein